MEKKITIDDMTRGKNEEIVVVKFNKEPATIEAVKTANKIFNYGIILGAVGAAIGGGFAFFSDISKNKKITAGILGSLSAVIGGYSAHLRHTSSKVAHDITNVIDDAYAVVNRDELATMQKNNSPHMKDIQIIDPSTNAEIAKALDDKGMQWRDRINKSSTEAVIQK